MSVGRIAFVAVAVCAFVLGSAAIAEAQPGRGGCASKSGGGMSPASRQMSGGKNPYMLQQYMQSQQLQSQQLQGQQLQQRLQAQQLQAQQLQAQQFQAAQRQAAQNQNVQLQGNR